MLTVTLIQSSLHWENPVMNRKMFTDKIHAAGDTGDLIILPEMFSTGFTMNAVQCAEEMEGPTMDWMHKIASEKKSVITGSIIIKEEGKYFNRLIWMRPDGSHNHYDKRHLFSLAKEEQTYSPGQHQWIFLLKGWKIFPLICYDLRFPVWSRRHRKLDYDLLIYVANWPARRSHAWKQLLIARAIENQCYVAGVNRVGADGNNILHTGDTALIDFKGETLSSFKASEEKIESHILSKDELTSFRNEFRFGEDGDVFELY